MKRTYGTTMLSSESDLIVVGGGFCGLVVASALARHGYRITVLEASEKPIAAFRGELLHPRGVSGLRALGIAPSLSAAGAAAVHGFAAFAGSSMEPALLPYGGTLREGAGFEHSRFVVSLRSALARNPRVRFETPARVTGLVRVNDRVTGVRCADGRTHRATLVVGADGRFSRTRKLLGIRSSSVLLSHTFAVEVPAAALRFPSYGHVFTGAPGPVLAYPIGEQRARVCIDVPVGAASGREEFALYLQRHYAVALPTDLRRALDDSLESGGLVGSPNHAVTVRRTDTPGALVAGDAAGCSHPLAATGMPCAVHDAEVLVACVEAHGLTDAACVAYRRRREFFSTARAVFAESLYAVLGGRGSGPEALRAGMFRYWRSSPQARETSMRLLSGEESRISTFLAEYGRVVGASSAHALANRALLAEPFAVVSALSALVATASLSMANAARRTVA